MLWAFSLMCAFFLKLLEVPSLSGASCSTPQTADDESLATPLEDSPNTQSKDDVTPTVTLPFRARKWKDVAPRRLSKTNRSGMDMLITYNLCFI